MKVKDLLAESVLEIDAVREVFKRKVKPVGGVTIKLRVPSPHGWPG